MKSGKSLDEIAEGIEGIKQNADDFYKYFSKQFNRLYKIKHRVHFYEEIDSLRNEICLFSSIHPKYEWVMNEVFSAVYETNKVKWQKE